MSNLINKTRLQKFAEGFWTKIKGRYDVAFKGVTLTDDKELKFTKIVGTDTVDVSLEKYARLQDRNKFEKDVSVDDAETKNNLSIGKRIGTVDPSRRSLGARNLSSGLFTDGYVSKFRVYLESTYAESEVGVHVWAIKKGDAKSADTTARDRVHRGTPITVSSNSGKKWIDIPINATFEHDTYFIFRTSAPVNVEAISSIEQENADHVINLNVNTPPLDAVGQPLDLSDQRVNETAYVEIFGRIGIVDLNKKIEKVSADSSLYVLKSETTVTGGNGKAGKVAKLGDDGKLDATMLPSIAVNDYFPVDTFTDAQLGALKYENGDVVFDRATQKRYLCINKGTTNSTTEFVELNSRDGVVQSVNSKTGAVELDLLSTTSEVKLTIGNGSGTPVEKVIPIISESDIDSIIRGLN